MIKRFGIDVSHWQGAFDFSLAKAQGVEYAIIKVGGADAGLYKDSMFEANYIKATSAKIGVGAYYFGAATNESAAIREAEHCVSLLAGKKYDYPIFYDVECASMKVGKKALTSIVRAFCETVEKAGYWCGFYTNLDWYRNQLNGAELASRFSFWCAAWTTQKPTLDNVQMWQFGGSINLINSNRIAGVVCDQDYAYIDYPEKIKEAGLNGYGKQTEKPTPTPSPIQEKKTVDELAAEVIRGEWGVGAARKKKLTEAGYDYNAVQKRVDEMLKPATSKKKSVTEIAKEVIRGEWGVGAARKKRLTEAGYDYNAVQAKVDELMRK